MKSNPEDKILTSSSLHNHCNCPSSNFCPLPYSYPSVLGLLYLPLDQKGFFVLQNPANLEISVAGAVKGVMLCGIIVQLEPIPND